MSQEPEPKTERSYDHVYLRMNEIVTAECDEVLAYISGNADIRRVRENPGRADALRYALGIAVKHIRAQRAQSLGAAEG